VFDTAGRLSNTFGRRGQGPDELSNISGIIVSSGDSILVRHGRRFSLFSPSFVFQRQIAVPADNNPAIFPLPSGAFLFTSLPTDPPSQRRLYQLTGSSGDSIAAFGPLARRDPNCASCNTRTPVAAAYGRVWVLTPRYELEAWLETGEMVASVSVAGSPWYDTSTTGFRSSPLEPPRTRITGVAVLDSNTIAVFGLRAAESWRPPPAAKVSTGSIGGIAVTVQRGAPEDIARAAARENDTFVDLIDLTRRAIVATGRFKEQTVLSLGGELAYSQRVDSLGVVHYDVWRLNIRRQP
jgi:hypothetical protein